jgi:hypothetical protein
MERLYCRNFFPKFLHLRLYFFQHPKSSTLVEGFEGIHWSLLAGSLVSLKVLKHAKGRMLPPTPIYCSHQLLRAVWVCPQKGVVLLTDRDGVVKMLGGGV